jgi:crotonobetainyl-CoA:carnitine CoA-transferase CaiB-like acyl-CoA transferase
MRPLEGYRVLDLTHVLAGPCATHHLRCLGAEVIKVERPETGDPMRALGMQPELGGLPPGFRALNAGKKSVVADLATEVGRAAVLALARDCDIFVENFRPGVAKRLGVGPDAIRAVRPDVIYCSISGWGQGGPNSGFGAYDHVIQAATGMMLLQGDAADSTPVKVGFPVIDIATGISAAEAILAAVIRRLRGDGAPITLDVSMVDSALALMSGPGLGDAGVGRSAATRRQPGVRRQSRRRDLRHRRRPHFCCRQHVRPVRDAVSPHRPVRAGAAAARSSGPRHRGFPGQRRQRGSA